MLDLIPKSKSLTLNKGYLLKKNFKPALISDPRLPKAIDGIAHSDDGA